MFLRLLRRVPDPDVLQLVHGFLLTATAREQHMTAVVNTQHKQLRELQQQLEAAQGRAQAQAEVAEAAESDVQEQQEQMAELVVWVEQLQEEKREEERRARSAERRVDEKEEEVQRWAGKYEDLVGRAKEKLREARRAVRRAAVEARHAEARAAAAAERVARAEQEGAAAVEWAEGAEEEVRMWKKKAARCGLGLEDACQLVRGQVLCGAQRKRRQVLGGGYAAGGDSDDDEAEGATGSSSSSSSAVVHRLASPLVAAVVGAVAGGESAERGVVLLSRNGRGIEVWSVPDPRSAPSPSSSSSSSSGTAAPPPPSATPTSSAPASSSTGPSSSSPDLLPAGPSPLPCPSGRLVVKVWPMNKPSDGRAAQAELVSTLALQGTCAGRGAAALVDWGVLPATCHNPRVPHVMQLVAVSEEHAGGSLLDAGEAALESCEKACREARRRKSAAGVERARTAAACVARDFGLGVLHALRPLHEARIVHNDVKGENFVLQHPAAGEGPVNVPYGGVDLSRAVRIDAESYRVLPAGHVTRRRAGMWTPGLQAPEQQLGSGAAWVCLSTDMWALGCELVEMAGRARKLVGAQGRGREGWMGAEGEQVMRRVERLAAVCCSGDAWARPGVGEAVDMLLA